MKNEMMLHYRGYSLPSKKLEYVQYPDSKWVDFTTEKKFGHLELQLWIDRALATEVGENWLDGWTKGLNKTCACLDYPKFVHEMWKAFIKAKAQVAVAKAIEKGFVEKYLSKVMDENMWNINGILMQQDVIA